MVQKTKRYILFMMVLVMLLCSGTEQIYAADFFSEFSAKDYIVGKLSATYYGDGQNKTFKVMVQDEKLYVEATNFAQKFDMALGMNGDEVQILLEDKWIGTRIASFKMNSRQAGYYDGTEYLEYDMPFASVQNEEGYWIPFRFAVKIMGAEMVLVGDHIYISEFHETIENAVSSTNKVYHKSAQIILGLGKYPEGRSNVEKEILLAELKEKDWVQKVSDVWDARSVSGANYDELASFLVSNYSPEFSQDSEYYLELLGLYVTNPILWHSTADYGQATTDIVSFLNGKSSPEEMAKMFSDSVIGLEEQNPEIEFNDAYRQIYTDTIGLDPIEKTWSEESIRMDEWLSQMISYKGLTANYLNQVYDSTITILNVPDGITNSLSVIFNEITVFRNINAANGYAMTLFDNYLASDYTEVGDETLYESLQERIDNYGQYMAAYRDTYMKDIFMFDTEDITDELIGDVLGEKVGTIWGIGKSVLMLHSDIQEAKEKDFLEFSGNYSAAKVLSRGLLKDVKKSGSPETAYLYYKTDAIALEFINQALASTEEHFFDNDIDRFVLSVDVLQMIAEESYHMSIIKMGIHHGLKPEDNEAYNEAYDDSTFLPLVIEVNSIMGNTNGNMNAGGFVCESDNYEMTLADTFWNDCQREVVDKNTDKTIGRGNGMSWWANFYEDGENAYLYEISNKGEIRFTNLDGFESEVIRSGQNKKLMLYNGYLYYQEGTTLYRREMSKGLAVGEETVILSDVGECIAYIEDDIYYSNLNSEVCRFSWTEGTEAMGIYSDSFDFIGNTMYYANKEDVNIIYAYDLLLATSQRVGEVANCYLLNANGIQLYYKVDDNVNQGLVYALTPYININRVVVYACYYPESTSSFPSEYYQWNTTGRRIFNVSNGVIYNEGAARAISPIPASGFSIKNIIMHFIYNLSEKLS